MNLKAVLLPLLATSTISGLTSSTLETTEDTSSTITQRNEPTQLYQREEVAEDTKSGRVSKRGLEEDLSTFVLKRKHFGLDIDGEAADDVVADVSFTRVRYVPHNNHHCLFMSSSHHVAYHVTLIILFHFYNRVRLIIQADGLKARKQLPDLKGYGIRYAFTYNYDFLCWCGNKIMNDFSNTGDFCNFVFLS